MKEKKKEGKREGEIENFSEKQKLYLLLNFVVNLKLL